MDSTPRPRIESHLQIVWAPAKKTLLKVFRNWQCWKGSIRKLMGGWGDVQVRTDQIADWPCKEDKISFIHIILYKHDGYIVFNILLVRLLTFSLFFHLVLDKKIHLRIVFKSEDLNSQRTKDIKVFLKSILRWEETSKPVSSPDDFLLQETGWCSMKRLCWVTPE